MIVHGVSSSYNRVTRCNDASVNGEYTMDRKTWKAFYRDVIRDRLEQARYNPRKAVCDENAAARRVLDECTMNGKIGIIRSGMDCDCTQYYAESVMDSFTSVAAFKRWDNQRQDYLDGPESVHFTKPENIKTQYKSRDLALMAYEEGRSAIYVVGYDDLI